MKLDTQRDRWQAVLDGHTLVSRSGIKVKFIDGYLHRTDDYSGGDWTVTNTLLINSEGWQLYEPAKPENKVIFVYHLPDADRYYVSGSEAPYINENDAIQAAMEWIGEKVTKLVLKRPAWANGDMEAERDLDNAFFCHTRLAIREALLERWPIEVLEEV